MSDAKPITPKELAAELNVDPKRLRAYLRANFARPAEAKNTSWSIPADAAKAARDHFEAKKAVATTDEPKADDVPVEA